MRRIETKGTVDDGQLSVQVPEDIAPGEHKIVVLIDEQADEQAPRQQPDDLSDQPVFHIGSWPEGLSLRREDMYDERGR